MSLPALNRWLLVQAVCWSAFLVAFPTILAATGRHDGVLWGLVGAAVVSFGWLWRVLGAGRTVADLATGLRFFALLAAAAWVWGTAEVSWLQLAVLVLVVCLDLVDGLLARCYGGSDAGAVLDMETDQFTTLVLAVLLHAVAGAGAFVLVLPAFRYASIFVKRVAGIPPHDPKPCDGDNARARLLCAAMMGLLLLALAPFGLAWLPDTAAALAVLALVWSYGADVAFFLRRSRPAKAG